jgi:hypothetical protein
LKSSGFIATLLIAAKLYIKNLSVINR